MFVFFSLPDELCKDIVSEWLDCEELGQLDSAVCSNKWRAQLLGLLPSFKGCVSYSVDRKALHWMHRRGITVHKLIICEDITGSRWKRALTSVWKNLRQLTVEVSANDSEFAADFNTCTSLEYLHIARFGFKIGALTGDVYNNLTYLNLPQYFGDSLPVLNLVHQHCRLLKTFHYEFKLTVATSEVLLDIIRLNVDLVSVKLPVNDGLLDELTALYSHKITHISLVGEVVDCNTMIHLLSNFIYADHISILNYIDPSAIFGPSVTFVKSRRSLEVENRGQELDGWKQFTALLPELQEIKWDDYDVDFVSLSELLGPSVTSLEIKCIEMDENDVTVALERCTGLKNFSFRSANVIEWSDVISDSNRIEKLTIEGSGQYLYELLTACRYLTEVNFTRCTMSHDMIPSLAAAIKKYRHATTGKPIVCECELLVDNDEVNIQGLHFDGSRFRGSLWFDYEELAEAYASENKESIARLTDRVKELEAEVEALKKQLLLQQQSL